MLQEVNVSHSLSADLAAVINLVLEWTTGRLDIRENLSRKWLPFGVHTVEMETQKPSGGHGSSPSCTPRQPVLSAALYWNGHVWAFTTTPSDSVK